MSVAIIDTSTLINIKHINRFNIIETLKYYLATTIYVSLEIENGWQDTKSFYQELKSNGKINRVPLEINDLIEMARVPNSKRISNAELSCFVKAKNMGCVTLCDDKKAIRYATRFIETGQIKGTIDILTEAYHSDLINEYEMKDLIDHLMVQHIKVEDDIVNNAIRSKSFKYIAACNKKNDIKI